MMLNFKMMCRKTQQKGRTGKEELEYRNSAALNEDMPGKSLNGTE
jgi:hypothetical protein